MIKLICTDIDGTLVPDGTSEINREIFEVILQLKQRGILFAAASGRQYKSMRELFAPAADDMMFVAEGGNLIMCREEEVAINRLNVEDVRAVIQDIEAIPGCSAMLSGPFVSYARRDASELLDLMINGYHYDIETVEDLEEAAQKEIIKISLYHKEGRAEELLEKVLLPAYRENKRMELLCAGDCWVDFSSAGSNKGTAIEKLQKMLRISYDETMVFGDNGNDIPMLRKAKYSFAVGNAKEEVKKAARYLADSNTRDGVLKELKKLLNEPEEEIVWGTKDGRNQCEDM